MPLIYAASLPTGIHNPESLRRRTGHRDSVNVRGVLTYDNGKEGLLPIEWVIFRNSDVMAVFDDDTLADR